LQIYQTIQDKIRLPLQWWQTKAET
jgi:hypothetical protein